MRISRAIVVVLAVFGQTLVVPGARTRAERHGVVTVRAARLPFGDGYRMILKHAVSAAVSPPFWAMKKSPTSSPAGPASRSASC